MIGLRFEYLGDSNRDRIDVKKPLCILLKEVMAGIELQMTPIATSTKLFFLRKKSD